MYYIDYAASDAYGTGTPYVAIVDKHTGSIVDNYNNMTDEEKAKRKQMNESKLEQSNRQRNNDVQNNETKNNNETQHTSSNEENQNSAQSETQNDVRHRINPRTIIQLQQTLLHKLKKNPQLLKWIVMNKHNQIIKVQIPKNKNKGTRHYIQHEYVLFL